MVFDNVLKEMKLFRASVVLGEEWRLFLGLSEPAGSELARPKRRCDQFHDLISVRLFAQFAAHLS